MTGRINETLQQNLIEPNERQKFNPLIGEVEYFDHKNYRASVKIPNLHVESAGGVQNRKSHIMLRQVPVVFTHGMHFAGPFKGDQVWVGFQNQDPKQPYIMGHADTKFAYSTRRDRTEHGTKGGFKADAQFTNKDNFKSKHAPNWFDRSQYAEDWTRELKHYSKTLTSKKFEDSTRVAKKVWTGQTPNRKKELDELDRSSLGSVEGVMKAGADSAFKHHAEVFIHHPFHTSGIKIKDNAQIDIFTHPHQGIRIDPDTRTINTHSEWMKMHHDEWRAWISGEVQWRVNGKYVCEVHGNHETHSDGLFEMHSRKSDVEIEAEKEHIRVLAEKTILINARTDDITIIADATNVNVIAKQDVNVNAGKNINMTAGSNVSIKAGSHIGLKAPRIDLN